jgi:hypothetical protein
LSNAASEMKFAQQAAKYTYIEREDGLKKGSTLKKILHCRKKSIWHTAGGRESHQVINKI